eukprot:TRINITY_DN1187_c0_g1_i2.p1 TRINITY_DN1187_c0_g1~~TRINITY_DN1187_c0_g1_i2.p1  ORF type:complete len:2158 (+),score=574.34 TRINITY_DN1187_c0_g1_i2:53-6526(+)
MSNTVKIDVTEKASLVLLVSEARRQDIRRLQQKGLKVEGALLANVNRKWGKIKREHLAMIGRGEDGRQVRARLACLFPFLGVIQEEEIQWYRERRAETVEKANSDATSSSSPFSSEDGSDRDPSSDEEEEEEEEETARDEPPAPPSPPRSPASREEEAPSDVCKAVISWEKGEGAAPLELTLVRVEGLPQYEGLQVAAKVWFGEESEFDSTNCEVTPPVLHGSGTASFDQQLQLPQSIDEVLRVELWAEDTLLCRGQLDLEGEAQEVAQRVLPMAVVNDPPSAEDALQRQREEKVKQEELARIQEEEEEIARQKREEAERAEAERLEKEEEEREEAERAEREEAARIEAERLRLEEEEKAEMLEAERIEAEKAEESRRLEEEDLEAERLQEEEAMRQAAEEEERQQRLRQEELMKAAEEETPVSPTPVRQANISQPPPSPSPAKAPAELAKRPQAFSFHIQQITLDGGDREVTVWCGDNVETTQHTDHGRMLVCKDVHTYLDSHDNVNITLKSDEMVLGCCSIHSSTVADSVNGAWCDIKDKGCRVGGVYVLPIVTRTPLDGQHTLVLTVHRCANLLAVPCIPSPSLKVTVGSDEHKLPELRNTRNPMWEYEILHDTQQSGVSAVVECVSGCKVIGVAHVTMCATEGEEFVPMIPKDREGVAPWAAAQGSIGAVQVEWKYVRDYHDKQEERARRLSTEAVRPLMMRLNVESAVNLAPLNVGERSCNAQVKVVVNGCCEAKSSVVASLSPVWGCDVDIPLKNELSDVRVQVFNDPLLTPMGDGFMGEVSFDAFEGSSLEWNAANLHPRPGNMDDLRTLNKYGTLGTVRISCCVEPVDASASLVPRHARPLSITVNVAEVEGLKNLPTHEPIWAILEAAGQTFTTNKMPHSSGHVAFKQQEANFAIEPQAARNFKAACTIVSPGGKVAWCAVPLGASTEFRRVPLHRKSNGKQVMEGTVLLKFDCPYSSRPPAARTPLRSVYLKVVRGNNLTSGDFTDKCAPCAIVMQCRNGYNYPCGVVLPNGLDFPMLQGPAADKVSHMRTRVGDSVNPVWNDVMKVVETDTPSSLFMVAVFDRGEFIGAGTVTVSHESSGSATLELEPRPEVPSDERRRRFNNGSLGSVSVEWVVMESPPVGLMISPLGWDLPSHQGDLIVKYSVSGRSGHPLFTSKLQSKHEAEHNPENQEAACNNQPLDFTTFHSSDATLYVSVWEGIQQLCVGSTPLTPYTTCVKLRLYRPNSPKSQCGSVSIRCKWQDKPPECATLPFERIEPGVYRHVVGVPVLGVTPEVEWKLQTKEGVANDLSTAADGDVIIAAEACEAVLMTREGRLRSTVECGNWITVVESKSLADNTLRSYVTVNEEDRALWATRVSSDGTWNETFSFPKAHNVKLQVFNAKGHFLGECTVPVGKGEEWLVLQARDNSEDDNSIRQRNRGLGALYVSWNLTHCDAPPPSEEQSEASEEHGQDCEDAKFSVSYVLSCGTSAMQPEGASLVKIKGKVYCLGGINAQSYHKHVIQYDTATRLWKPVAKQVPLRHGHSTVVYKGKAYIYGGFGPGGFDRRLIGLRERGSHLDDDSPDAPKNQGYHLSTWVFDPATLEWSEVQTEGTALDYRIDHSATLVNHKMIVWGGWKVLVQETSRQGQKSYKVIEHRRNDMCYLNLDEMKWKKVKQKGTVPSARCSHTITKHKLDLVLFGGCTEEIGSSTAAPSTRTTDSKVDDDDDDDLLSTSRPTQNDKKPNSSIHHDIDPTITALNDVYTFDLSTKTWSKTKTYGLRPSPRYGHSSLLDPSGATMLVVGGWGNAGVPLHSIFQLHLESRYWRKVTCWGTRPPVSRLGHGAVIIHAGRNTTTASTGDATPDKANGKRTSPMRQPSPVRNPSPMRHPSTPSPLFQLLVAGGLAQEAYQSPSGPPASDTTSSSAAPPARYKPKCGVQQGTILLNFTPVGMAEVRSSLVLEVSPPKPPAKPAPRKKKQQKKTQEQLDVIVGRLTSRKSKRQTQMDQLVKAREKEQVENACKRMTMEEMKGAAERLYYIPMRKARKRDETPPVGGKRLKEAEQAEHIERLYYKAKDDMKVAMEQAMLKQEEELNKVSIHKNRATLKDQIDITERLHYKPMEAHSVLSPRLHDPPKNTATMTQNEWAETIKRLYTPARPVGNVFEQRGSL